MSLLVYALLASVIFQHLFNTILSLVGYMGHNYARIGGKIMPNFLQCGFESQENLFSFPFIHFLSSWAFFLLLWPLQTSYLVYCKLFLVTAVVAWIN